MFIFYWLSIVYSIVTCNFQINKALINCLIWIWRDWFVIVIGIVILTVDYWKVSSLWIPIQLLMLRRIFLEIEEIFLGGGPIQYLKSKKNWMQVLNFTLIFCIIWLPNNICDIKRQMAAFALVFSLSLIHI